MNRPNIVLCVCDQLRAFEVGCYGNPVIRTPNVDRLARHGMRVQTAVSTFPVCMAARSVLLSGQYNRTCTGGVTNVSNPGRPGEINLFEYPDAGRPHLKETTLPELLRAQGYHMAAIGKWHIHSWPHDVGFDHYIIPRVHHCHTGQSFTENGGPEFVPEGYSVDYEASRVERFLNERRGEAQPFFLYYNISPPHCPLADAPEEFRTMYRSDEVVIRPNVRLDEPLKNQEHAFKVYRWDYRYYNLHLPYTEQLPEGYSLRHLIAEYYGLTTWMDSAVGRMMDALEEAGLAENTIVIFTSDHGDNLGSHGLVQKGQPTEESIRIPLVIRWPGKIDASRMMDTHVMGLVDIAPTILGMIGERSPSHFHGRDFAPLLRGKKAELDECAIVETPRGVAIRSTTHLYHLDFAPDKRALAEKPSMFFDLVNDPYQMNNLAERAEGNETARALDAKLRNWNEVIPWMTTGAQ